jgi:hypothetical protein
MTTGHQRITYACGIHIETQCRCLGHGKETVVGKRACPHCASPARLHNERVDRIRDATVQALAEVVVPADLLLLARAKIDSALDTLRLPESTRRPSEDWCTCNATHECEGHRA